MVLDSPNDTARQFAASARAGKPLPVSQDGLRPLGQVLRCAAVIGTVTDLVAQVGLRLLQMSLQDPQ
jgi:hypothetical protein